MNNYNILLQNDISNTFFLRCAFVLNQLCTRNVSWLTSTVLSCLQELLERYPPTYPISHTRHHSPRPLSHTLYHTPTPLSHRNSEHTLSIVKIYDIMNSVSHVVSTLDLYYPAGRRWSTYLLERRLSEYKDQAEDFRPHLQGNSHNFCHNQQKTGLLLHSFEKEKKRLISQLQ